MNIFIISLGNISTWVKNKNKKNHFLTQICKSTLKHSNKPQSRQSFGRIVPYFHGRCWRLCSKRGCLRERTGCSVAFPTELLSCLMSTQRSSSMRVKSPRSIPTYRLRFQPQPSARGSEVDATRNLLGAGMRIGSNPPSPPPLPKMSPFPTLGSSQRLDRCCAVAAGAIVLTSVQLVWLCYRIPIRPHGLILQLVEPTCWECERGLWAIHSPVVEIRLQLGCAVFPPLSDSSHKPASQFIMREREEGERAPERSLQHQRLPSLSEEIKSLKRRMSILFCHLPINNHVQTKRTKHVFIFQSAFVFILDSVCQFWISYNWQHHFRMIWKLYTAKISLNSWSPPPVTKWVSFS